MSIFNHLNKLKPFVPGLAGYGQYVFRDYVFQLFASYPSVGLLVERNDFFLVGVAAGSVAIFFTSEWIGKNLLQFVPIYNRW